MPKVKITGIIGEVNQGLLLSSTPETWCLDCSLILPFSLGEASVFQPLQQCYLLNTLFL